jgi:hypothetical protein
MTTSSLLALILYPGLAFAVLLGVGHALLSGRRFVSAAFAALLHAHVWQSGEGLLALASIVLAGAGLACMPFPLLSLAPDTMGIWLLAWGGLEGAFLLPLLPALLTGMPQVARAAIREAQIGAAGRLLLWLALIVGLSIQTYWQQPDAALLVLLPPLVLAIVAAVFALPAAIGWGPYASDAALTTGGVAQGLGKDVQGALQAARYTRTAALLAASLVALVPFVLLPPVPGLIVLLVAVGVVSVLMRRLDGRFPILALPDAINMCWWRALPAASTAVVYLILYA